MQRISSQPGPGPGGRGRDRRAPRTGHRNRRRAGRPPGGGGRPFARRGHLPDRHRQASRPPRARPARAPVRSRPFRARPRSACSGPARRQTKALRPLAVSDEFDFGLFVCGDVERSWAATPPTGSTRSITRRPRWAPTSSRSRAGRRCSGTSATRSRATEHRGRARAPGAGARQARLAPSTVRVWSYDSAGKRKPAAGAVVQGEGDATTDAQGRATVKTPKRGTLQLRAERGADIASQTLSVCITAKRTLRVAAGQANHRHRQGRTESRAPRGRTRCRAAGAPTA